MFPLFLIGFPGPSFLNHRLLYLAGSVLLKEGEFASVDNIHDTGVEKCDEDIDECHGANIQGNLYVKESKPGIRARRAGQMAASRSGYKVK